MKKLKNYCVDCGLPCLGSSCSNRNVPVYYCDNCGSMDVEYRIDDEDYCTQCAHEFLDELFRCLPLSEKAEILEVEMKHIGG